MSPVLVCCICFARTGDGHLRLKRVARGLHLMGEEVIDLAGVPLLKDGVPGGFVQPLGDFEFVLQDPPETKRGPKRDPPRDPKGTPRDPISRWLLVSFAVFCCLLLSFAVFCCLLLLLPT